MKNDTKILVIVIIIIGLGLVYTSEEVSSLQNKVEELDRSIVESSVTIDNEESAQTYKVNLTRGASALEALQRVAKVDTKSFKGMGTYVTGINGLYENKAQNKYWMVYKLGEENQEWTMLNVGANSYELEERDNIKFSYEKASW